MEVTELRIGNLVAHENRADILLLNSVSRNKCAGQHFDDLEQFWADNAQWFYGIPLTKEWLIKFGFYQTPELIEKYGSGNWGNGKRSLIFIDGEVEIHMMKCKYVHQLQNAYFCLEHEELPLKNK